VWEVAYHSVYRLMGFRLKCKVRLLWLFKCDSMAEKSAISSVMTLVPFVVVVNFKFPFDQAFQFFFLATESCLLQLLVQ
jgi:hypothetical protein